MRKKIVLTYKNIEGNFAEETIWAIQLESGNFEIDNIPFFAENLAYKDIISAENDLGLLYFDALVKPSEHSTVQIVFFRPEMAEELLKKLELLGCGWEGMEGKAYYAVDVPKELNYLDVKLLLDKGAEEGILDYKESCLGTKHSNEHIF